MAWLMRKRILLISNVFPPAIGGPATYGARMAEELSRKGFNVTFVCATPAPNGFDDRYPFRVIRTGTQGNRLRREMEVRTVLLWAMLKANLVYCMGLEHQSHWAAGIARTRCVIRIGGDRVWERARNIGATRLEPEPFYTEDARTERSVVSVEEDRRLGQMRDAASIIYVSAYLKKLGSIWAERRGGSEYVVPNGIEIVSSVSPVTRKPNDVLRVLFVGRQTNWKGVDGVLLALAQIDGVALTVAGSGPLWPANVDLCRRVGLAARTRFLNHVDDRQIYDLMRQHHILVLPSLYEGMSNTILEAGAAGLACIVSDRGGNPEVIDDGKNGLLVDPFDTDQLARAISKLRDSESERIRLAVSHYRRVHNDFSLSESVQRTVNILENVYENNASNIFHIFSGRGRRRTISKRTGD